MIKKILNKIKSNSKKLKFLSVSLFAFVIVLFFIFNDHGILNIYLFSDRKDELNNSILLERKRNDSLKQVLELVKNDKLTIERIAREKYGYVKPGERVYFISLEKSEK